MPKRKKMKFLLEILCKWHLHKCLLLFLLYPMVFCLLGFLVSSNSVCLIHYYLHSTSSCWWPRYSIQRFLWHTHLLGFMQQAWHEPEIECGCHVLPCPCACISRGSGEVFMPSTDICTFLPDSCLQLRLKISIFSWK